MKCPKCNHNQKAKYGLKCGKCAYCFTFDPRDTETRGLTDGKFLGCIKAASRNGTSWYTQNQLYAVYCRRIRPSTAGQLGCGIAAVIGGLFLLAGKETVVFGVAAVIVGALLVLGGLTSKGKPKITPAQFRGILDRWRSSGKTLDRLISEPTLHEPPPEWDEPDIYDYGVERLLIVERDVLVDLFVRNGTHADLRMLVLSESGYPDYLLPVAHRLLDEQPDLPVFLLHDATPHGVAMQERVEGSDLWQLAGHPVTDLGMFPDDFRRLQRMREFDPDNERRGLPVDALLLAFMLTGLEQAMTEGTTLGVLIEQQQRTGAGDGGGDFG